MSSFDMDFQHIVMGSHYKVPLISQKEVRYVNLDNAASTPPFRNVMEKVNKFSVIYSSVHRGNGYKSILCTEIYEDTRKVISDFIGSDMKYNTVIYTKNSTEAINKLANCFQFNDGDIVICSRMEHHSNDLPWRDKAEVKYIEVNENGELDMDHYEALLNSNKGKIRLVAITGASNVTGFINEIHNMAAMAHEAGAKILVDGSQLVPHRRIDIKSPQDNQHIDFIVFTAHKMYSPFGIGVLVGPVAFFNEAEPDTFGGGIVRMVTDDEVYWEDTPERNEAGTPNLIGAVALSSSIGTYEDIGLEKIEEHENMLTSYLLEKLSGIDGIRIYGCSEADKNKRLGVVAFDMEGVKHSLLASILSYEYGIGVRNGCFCAHPYVLRLLGIDSNSISKYRNEILSGDKSNLPGLVRVSLGMYNTCEDVDRCIQALNNISRGEYSKYYIDNIKHGNYIPVDWAGSASEY